MANVISIITLEVEMIYKSIFVIFQRETGQDRDNGLTRFEVMDEFGNYYVCTSPTTEHAKPFDAGQPLVLDGYWENESRSRRIFFAEAIWDVRIARFISLAYFEAYKRKFVWPVTGKHTQPLRRPCRRRW